MNKQINRAAVIAIGSNSTRLLVANLDGQLSQPLRARVETKLLLAMDAQHKVAQAAAQTLAQTVADLSAQAQAAGAQQTSLIATAALRELAGREALIGLIHQMTGLDLQVISGEQEAHYAFLGAAHPYAGQLGVVDIGGGSTELAMGDADGVQRSTSLLLGASRLYANCPINSVQDVARAAGIIDCVLDENLQMADWAAPARWLLVGGTGTALTGLLQGHYPPHLEADAPISLAQARGVLMQLASLIEDARAALPGMTPGRERILPTGLVILVQLMSRLQMEHMLVTRRNNTDGWLYSQIK